MPLLSSRGFRDRGNHHLPLTQSLPRGSGGMSRLSRPTRGSFSVRLTGPTLTSLRDRAPQYPSIRSPPTGTPGQPSARSPKYTTTFACYGHASGCRTAPSVARKFSDKQCSRSPISSWDWHRAPDTKCSARSYTRKRVSLSTFSMSYSVRDIHAQSLMANPSALTNPPHPRNKSNTIFPSLLPDWWRGQRGSDDSPTPSRPRLGPALVSCSAT